MQIVAHNFHYFHSVVVDVVVLSNYETELQMHFPIQNDWQNKSTFK